MNSLWYSLVPLLAVNFFGLLSLVYYLLVAQKTASHDGFEAIENRHHSKLLGKTLKGFWFWLTSPVERLAIKWSLTPNFFTTLGLIICVFSGLSYALGKFGLAGWLVILGGTCDMFDGRIARLTKQGTKSGAFYDSVMDRFGEMATLFGLAVFYRESWVFYFVILAIIGSMMVSYTRARGEGMGVQCAEGSMQRPERIVYLGVSSIFSPLFSYFFKPLFSFLNPSFLLDLALILVAVMTLSTSLFRTRWIYQQIEAKA